MYNNMCLSLDYIYNCMLQNEYFQSHRHNERSRD